MDFNEKRTAAFKLLQERGVPRGNEATPYHQLLWRLGVEVPPPLFAELLANFLVMYVGFTVVFAAFLLAMSWFGVLSNPTWFTYLAMLFVGIPVALLWAYSRRAMARKYDVPLWRDFEPAQPVPPAR